MIKIIERKIKEAEQYTDITGLCLTLDKELCNAFINILSDYKRVLKENEYMHNELNKQQTTINKYAKENEELKILKSAIQTLQNLGIEDGKYIVMSKTDFLNGSCKHLLDDYIPIQKIKDKIEELEKRKQEYEEENTIDEDYFFDINGYNSAIFVLQELLELESGE